MALSKNNPTTQNRGKVLKRSMNKKWFKILDYLNNEPNRVESFY